MTEWTVYIVECVDKTYYTGITINLTNRLAAHERGIAAKYTKARRPVKLVYKEYHPTRSSALKREAIIKEMSRGDKQDLIDR